MAFGIDAAFCGRDLVAIEIFNLRDAILIVHLRRGSGNGDIHPFKLHRETIGPAILAAFHRLQIITTRHLPTHTRMGTERGGDRSGQCRGRIMPRLAGRARRKDAVRFIVVVPARIPAAAGHVDAEQDDLGRPEERREIFEEAAGIAKYKLRVRTAENKSRGFQ